MRLKEAEHKARLAELPCMACVRLYGPHGGGNVVLHHLRAGGWGKGSYLTLIPLCHRHHDGEDGIHRLGTKAWERVMGFTQQELLDDALTAIYGE